MGDEQRCYICGRAFDDKVKLGLHLTPCYNEAVNVRKEMWHPHPLDLVDEQRYTDYMRGRFELREREIAAARGERVSHVTAGSFNAMRGTLGTPFSQIPSRVESRSGCGQEMARLPPPQSTRVRFVAHECDRKDGGEVSHGIPGGLSHRATGVTMLKHELTEELSKIRRLRETEESLIEERQRVFEQMCGQVASIRKPKGDSLRLPPPSGAQPEAIPEVAQIPPTARGVGSEPQRSGGSELSDGRVQCHFCGKLFGKKGYEVHAKRCLRPSEELTWSRDAEYVKHHPEERVKADHDGVSYGRQHVPEVKAQKGAGDADDAWTQFMVTYPRPILEERPKSTVERNAAASNQAQRNAYNQMVNNELSRGSGGGTPQLVEATVPCGRCGRFFYASRVARHEVTCVSKPKR